MAWVITQDHTTQPEDGLPSRVGRGQWGDENVPGTEAPKLPLRFRLRYEDEEDGVAYSGRYDVAAVQDDDEEWGGLYQALKWGEWDVGATILQVRCDEYIAAAGYAPDSPNLKYITPDKEGWYIPYG